MPRRARMKVERDLIHKGIKTGSSSFRCYRKTLRVERDLIHKGIKTPSVWME